jgi:fluoride exporter
VSATALLLVASGGAAGSVLRYLVGLLATEVAGAGYPWGTLAVNVIGSAAIGVLAGLGVQGELRLLLVTGFLGGFTTFSAFSLEVGAMAQESRAMALGYVLASVGSGLLAFAAGLAFGRRG